MQPPSTAGLRHRPPTITQKIDTNRFSWRMLDKVYNESQAEVVVNRKMTSMYDLTTPDFRRRSAEGEVFNNPMIRYEEDFSFPLVSWTYNDDTQGLNLGLYQPPMVQTRLLANESVFTNNIENAITDAYANVSANEGNALLWIGEARETVAMLMSIGGGIRVLYEKTKEQRKRWAKGKLTVEAQQQLTLQLLYGILPLEQQIADFMEGLFAIKQANSRNTARGYRTKVTSATYSETVSDHNASAWPVALGYMAVVEESLTVTARAGVLYEIDIDKAPWLSVILDPKSVISTAYALARLSFVIDWFINVGGTLAAWSPSMGVNELAAWVTVEKQHVQVVKYLPPVTTKPSRAYPNGGGYTRIVTEKWRKPVSRNDLALIPRLDLDLGVEKLLAMVLLFAKIKKSV